MDEKIRSFSLTINNFVNESELPHEVKRLVLYELLQKETEIADATVKEQYLKNAKKKEGVKNAKST